MRGQGGLIVTKQNRTSNLSFLVLVLVIFLCLSYLWQADGPAKLDYAQVRQLFQQEKVVSFRIDENALLTMTLKGKENEDKLRYQLYSFDLFYDDLDPLVQEQAAKGIITSYDYPPHPTTNWVEVLLPWALTAVLLAGVWYFMAVRSQGGMGPDKMAKFSSARTRTLTDKDKKVTFDDVAGADEEKEELQEIVEFLREHPFRRLP